jgi:hypothetical protein
MSRGRGTRVARRALTLVEVLLCCSIAALAATLAIGALDGTAEASVSRRAETEVLRFDQTARLLARTEGALECVVDPSRPGDLVARSRHDGGIVLRASLPSGCVAALEPSTLGIDALGRSADVVYVIGRVHSDASGSAREAGGLRIAVLGATGQPSGRPPEQGGAPR